MHNSILKPEYRKSWALIIGINKYLNFPPLEYARNDAKEVAKILEEKFNFEKENIYLLIDQKATKEMIMISFFKFAQTNTKPDDRILIFFAGHGHTLTGNSSEVGFLVPADGNLNDLSTLIRWDDLTKNADLIKAKHLFFVMDACYGGLAITRAPQPGRTRFLKNMLQRYSRQILTAGKADEQVADYGGPLPKHSIFTGYLLEALEGKASKDGVITANNVMSYVYEKVSKDNYSKQSPHFGFLEGDGDFIFNVSILDSLKEEGKKDNDFLYEIPYTISEKENKEKEKPDVIEKTKEYLSHDRYRIKMDDLAVKEIRRSLSVITEKFSLKQNVSSEEFIERLKVYESITYNLQAITVCIAYWGNTNYIPVLKKIISRMAENQEIIEGKEPWIALRWYPTIILLYSGGISSIAADNYQNLTTIFTTKISQRYKEDSELVFLISEALERLKRTELFQTLPEYKQKYVPISEYLFKLLQPLLGDLLFIGKDYERVFDRFEVFLALVHADLCSKKGVCIWGPVGRFGWKYNSLPGMDNIFKEIRKEAEDQKNEWLPLKSGLFGGSYERFIGICQKYEEDILKKLHWY